MAGRQGKECLTRRPNFKLSSEVQFHTCEALFTMDKELLALKSEKVAKLMQKRPQENLSHLLHDIPADEESFEIVARFCHGLEINLSTENVVRVTCVAHYLGMTDSHCPNNLLNKSLLFFEQEIIPSWNNSIKALNSTENVLEQALELGLVDYCVESVVSKVLEDPSLLGEPIKNSFSDDENECDFIPNSQRKFFNLDWKSEDLTVLSLRLYEYIFRVMDRRQVPQEYMAANLCEYANKWAFPKEGDDISIYSRNSHREIVQVLEKLLPHQRGILPCTFLFKMLHFAMALDAKAECKNGLEIRIGKQLDHASVKDLLIPAQGYAKDELYDTDCVTRILQNFYRNYTGPDDSRLLTVAELMDEFLAEISADIDLKMSTFMTFADMSVAASTGTPRSSDGIYRAINIYLDKHRLTESEREELCRILDCNKLSREACEHAAQNNRLPMRIVVQVLFVGQLKLRDFIMKEVEENSDGRFLTVAAAEEEEGGARIGDGEEEVRTEIEKMGDKVLELERECNVMKREIQRGSCSNVKRQKESLWKEMKRKLGCSTKSMHDSNCHVKKKKKVNP